MRLEETQYRLYVGVRERLATYEFDTEAITELQEMTRMASLALVDHDAPQSPDENALIATVAEAIVKEVPEPSQVVTGTVVRRVRQSGLA